MSIDAIFKALDAGLKADPGVVKRVQGVYAFNITNTDGSKANWVVDLKNGNGAVTQGTGAADCTITIGATDFVDLMQGKLNGQQAFMGGKLKIGGNMMLAMKLSELTKSLNAGQAAAPAAAAPAAATPAAAASNSDGLSAVFAQVRHISYDSLGKTRIERESRDETSRCAKHFVFGTTRRFRLRSR